VQDPRVAGYRVKYGTASNAYTHSVDVAGRTDVVLTELHDGVTYFIVAVALDHQGREGPTTRELVVSAR
jgi:hypothetical protein